MKIHHNLLKAIQDAVYALIGVTLCAFLMIHIFVASAGRGGKTFADISLVETCLGVFRAESIQMHILRAGFVGAVLTIVVFFASLFCQGSIYDSRIFNTVLVCAVIVLSLVA
ncbi:hypothetical protein [Stieleria varia]|uniref:hypothetical protein n=1 Tax=Stieleria varia TaxID=2528005 RepID=UPI0011B5E78F|nr:hypothetical protein [Stieleria varia]